MKTILKIFSYLLLTGVVLIGVAALLIKVFIPPEKAQAFLEKRITTALHREVQLGQVSVGVQGVSVSDFKLSERPTFSAGTFIASERLVVRPRLLPLLKRQLVIREILLIKPRITIVREASGEQFNFSDLMARDQPMPAVAAAVDIPPSTPTATAPLHLTVGRASVEQGRIDFIDRSTAAWSATVSELNLRVNDVRPNASAQLQSDFLISVRGVDSKLALNGTLEWPKILIVKRLLIESGRSQISLAGSATSLNTLPAFDFSAEIQALDPGLIKTLVTFPSDLAIIGPLSGTASASGTAEQLRYSTALNFDPVTLTYGKSFSKPAGVPMSMLASGNVLKSDTLTAEQLKFTLGDLVVSGKGDVRDLTKKVQRISAQVRTNEFSAQELMKRLPAATLPEEIRLESPVQAQFDLGGTLERLKVAFEARVNNIKLKGDGDVNNSATELSYAFNIQSDLFSLTDVAAAVPMLKEYAPSGHASLRARVTSDAMPVSGKLTLAKANVRYEKSELTQLSGLVDFTTKVVSAPRITGKLNGSELWLSLNGKSLDTHPTIESHVSVQTLDLERLIPSPSPTPTGKKTHRSLFVETAWAAPAPAARAASLPMDLKGSLKAEAVQHPFLQAQSLDLRWDVTSVTPDLAQLGGTASLRQGRGQVKNIQKLVEGSKAAKVLLLPLTVLQKLNKATGGTMRLPTLDQLTFNKVAGDYVFKAGVMTVSKFELDGTEMDADLTGTAELSGEQKLGMKSVVRLAENLVGGTVGDLLRDGQGRVTLPLTIKGTIGEPKISVDAASTGKNIIEAIKNDPDKVKNVEKLLKGIFK